MVRKVILLFNTVRHLKARQVFYRIYYHFKKIHLLQQEVGGELALLNEFNRKFKIEEQFNKYIK